MKKLVIVNHLGEIVKEADVYVEGEDLELVWSTPTAVWLGKIIICDLEKFEAWVTLNPPSQIPIVEPEPEPEPVAMMPIYLLRCCQCGWEGSSRDCQVGHDDYLCPQCGQPALEERREVEPEDVQDNGEFEIISEGEVKPDDLETASDSSVGDKRTGEAEQSPSAETTPEKPAGRKAAKRSRRVRDAETA